MKYYYVALVGEDVWFSSSSLPRVEESIRRGKNHLPKYFEKRDVKILCFEFKEERKWEN